MKAVVAGAGGFIGGHLTGRLLDEYDQVFAVDMKPEQEWHQFHSEAKNLGEVDLRIPSEAQAACRYAGDADVFMLAADMGGMGFIETHKVDCMLSVLASTNMLRAAAARGARRFFYASSACVYAAGWQTDPNIIGLREADAYPAMPEDGYGWEKLFSERMCRHFTEEVGLETRVARYHNVYGPHGTYAGGREKAPAAICRKVIEAQLSGRHDITIWGDGKQTRSFMYIDDCVEGTLRILRSECSEPLNLGSDRLVSIDELVTIVEGIAGVTLRRSYDLTAPQGVRGRNSDNTLLQETVGWAPQTGLEDGLERTYAWIWDQMTAAARTASSSAASASQRSL